MPTVLNILKGAGCRITAPRKAMAAVLDRHGGQHLSAQEIRLVLRRGGVSVNLASIYRNLKLLERLGAVHRGGPPHAHHHFELEHGAEVHLVCTQCGALLEATSDNPHPPAQLAARLRPASGFHDKSFPG